MANLLLVIDVGNTQIALGVYDDADLKAQWRLGTRASSTGDELSALITQMFNLEKIDIRNVADVAISCVVPPLVPALNRFCVKTFGKVPLSIGPGIKTGISIAVDDPREVGADRIVNAVGGVSMFAPPLVIVDFGTAITVDAVSERSEYLGGAIVPGIQLSLNALCHKAAKLPKVEMAEPPSVIGRNTVHSIQSGAFFGYISLVDGIVNKMKPLIGSSAKVIATGGEASQVAHVSGTIDLVVENLTLEGLRVVHEKNRGGDG